MSAFSALLRKNWWQLRNLRRVLRGQSRFKILFVSASAILFEAGLYGLFLDGFRFLDKLGGAGLLVLNHLLSFFFMGMGIMLAISSVVSSYATVFRSREIPFLLTRPFDLSEVVMYKSLQSAVFSSWAFTFIVIPFVAAYADYLNLSPLFALWTLLFSIPFLLLCAGIGTCAVLALVRWAPRGRALKLIVACLLVLAGALAVRAWHGVYRPGADAEFTLSRLVPGLRPASNKLAPSWWVSTGVHSLIAGEWLRGTMLWVVLASTALAMTTAVEWLGTSTFFDAWQRVEGSGRRSRRAVLLPRLERALGFLGTDLRALIMKDVRVFWRDPAQWSQTLIFFGLLALYFSNLRQFRYHMLPDAWRNAIAFLNVFSVSAVVCSLGSRFVYPQLSLEGHGFWVLGLSPVSMTKVLIAKFLLALAGILAVSAGLMSLSAAMLKAAPVIQVTAVALAAAISAAVCGLSTGLGAVFLDLNNRNPAAIVSGFGGTLNLVLSLLFMLAAILPFASIFHLRAIGAIRGAQALRYAACAGIWLVAVTALATALPLCMGNRSLRNRDYSSPAV